MLDIIFMLIPPVAIFCAIYAALRSFKTGKSGSRAYESSLCHPGCHDRAVPVLHHGRVGCYHRCSR